MADYREAPAVCPACRAPMEQRVLSEATVDTCPLCRGLWVDWFDGDLVAVAKETAPLSFRSDGEVPERGECPRCTRALVREAFGGAVTLLRCAECGGSFVPRASFNALLDLERPSSKAPDTERDGAFARLLAVIRSLFHA